MPADLAANEDAQLTPEIRALAASLGNEPVRIFNWVRNNITFVPTHGSVQGSQLTLDSKRGNAYDTASLLVALLRAANVPARYVTGSVEVPIATAMNWVGGASTPAVAQELFGTGGVPTVAMTSGGKITHLRLEHVWVEAHVDFVPSRGAIHRQGDTWVPMDAAFKQHTFTSRSAYFTDVPFANVLDPAVRPFDVDEDLGRITNVDETALRERLAEWAEQSADYFYSHDVPQTFDGLLGGRNIVPEEPTVLAGALPYKLLSRGTAVSTLPSRLRHSVVLRGYDSALDRALESPSFTVSVSLPAVNSKRLGLQFDPASPADANTLRAAREGNASSLPVYLVNVVPTVKLDGTALGNGGAIRMGSDFYLDVVLQAPEGPTVLPYEVVAGDEIVIGVTGNGVTREVVEKRFAANPVDNAPEYLHQVQLHYWMESDYFAQITAKGMDVHMLRLPSVGLFSSPLTVSSFFGIPRWGVYQGRSMDVKQTLLGVVSPVPGRGITFMKQVGIQSSYLEGAIFDQLQDRSQGQAFVRRGISAIHLLSVAAAQDIPIYNITASNADEVLPRLALSADVESDVSAAIAAGKTVLVSERDVDMGPWKGVGYIITDETTGAGAYMISGGLAGGGLLDCLRKLVPVFEKVGEILLALLIAVVIILIFVGALGTMGPAGAPVGAAAAAAFLLLILGRDSLDSVTPMEA
ncbi:transglutaminase-like domain-containing protein [Pyxidicoccus sp. 3LFB2]